MMPLPPFSVKLEITDVAYVTYRVPEERLRPFVPEEIRFAGIHDAGLVFLSLVMFHNRNVRASFFPFVRFNYDQLNVRTYIIDPVTGKTAVLFLRSGITSGIMSRATKLMGIPWPVMTLAISAEHSDNKMTSYGAVGKWGGEVDIQLHETPEPGDYTPFRGMKDAVEFLVTPTAGFYTIAGGVLRFEVQHTFVYPTASGATSVQFPMLEECGYLANGELRHPHNVLITPRGFFRVLLPPKRISL